MIEALIILIIIVVSLSLYLYAKNKKKESIDSKLSYSISYEPPRGFKGHAKYSAPDEARKVDLKKKYEGLSIEEIMFNNEIADNEKVFLVREIHNCTYEEAQELLNETKKEIKKAKLKESKMKITKKAQELFSKINIGDERAPISDEVKMYVWQRDGGKCVKCGSQEKLEFDHIIPFSKGGSNTERNIQILCEKCNREKKDKI